MLYCIVEIMFNFIRNCQLSSKEAASFYITAKSEDFCCSISLPAFGIVSGLDFRCVNLVVNFNCSVFFLVIPLCNFFFSVCYEDHNTYL